MTSPATTANSTSAAALTTNLRYIFPLYEHIFSLSPAFPSNALAFVGLPVLIANCPSDRAQALFISHAIADPSVLPPRGEMLDALVAREASVRARDWPGAGARGGFAFAFAGGERGTGRGRAGVGRGPGARRRAVEHAEVEVARVRRGETAGDLWLGTRGGWYVLGG